MSNADDPAAADALVLFGATGDLAHKMIFPALYAMVKRGAALSVPVIGVAYSKWDIDQVRDRVRDARNTARQNRGSADWGLAVRSREPAWAEGYRPSAFASSPFTAAV
jgi:glucose-6-phosphate 1-dehydrogenase